MWFLCSEKENLASSKYSILSSHWCCFPTLLCSRVLPSSPDHVCPASCPYLTVLFGQQQEPPTCVCVPLMKHHVQMLAFVPQVYDHCIDRCLNLNDLSLLLACWELFYELQGKLILYVCFLASYSACYSCYLKEMGQELSSSVVHTRICAGPELSQRIEWWGWLETSLLLPCGTRAPPGSGICEQAAQNYSVGKDQLLQVLESTELEVFRSLS